MDQLNLFLQTPEDQRQCLIDQWIVSGHWNLLNYLMEHRLIPHSYIPNIIDRAILSHQHAILTCALKLGYPVDDLFEKGFQYRSLDAIQLAQQYGMILTVAHYHHPDPDFQLILAQYLLERGVNPDLPLLQELVDQMNQPMIQLLIPSLAEREICQLYLYLLEKTRTSEAHLPLIHWFQEKML